MRPIKFTVVALAFILAMMAMGLVKPAQAEMVTLAGPVYVVGQAGIGSTESGFLFRAPVPGKGVVQIRNGGDNGSRARVSSAKITLNGVEIAVESDFNKGVEVLSYDVDLQALNQLDAVLKSCNHCELEITVLGEAVPAPTAQDALLQQFGRLP